MAKVIRTKRLRRSVVRPIQKGRRMQFSNLIRKVALSAALALVPAASFAGVFISVGFAPPVLPVYTQPMCPGDGYFGLRVIGLTGRTGYYWVPGVWVRPPQVGLLWTPGYWGWGGGAYIFHAGYWGPHVGFYGGVNYGFGYGGVGFVGGRWEGGHFAYNTAVVNVNRTVMHNVYRGPNGDSHDGLCPYELQWRKRRNPGACFGARDGV